MSGQREEAMLAEELLERLAVLARRLSAADDLDELLQLIANLGPSYLDGCDGASLMFVGRDGRISSPAYSSSVAFESDQAQFATGEGPCLDSLRDHHTIIIDDLETETRWPAYRARALALGVRSMISFRLFVLEDTMGALSFYSAGAHAFGRAARVLGQVFASHAGAALTAAITEAGLDAALASRDVIGQAKGILMERRKLPAEDAFAELQRISQRSNRPLSEIAAEIAVTGNAPRTD